MAESLYSCRRSRASVFHAVGQNVCGAAREPGREWLGTRLHQSRWRAWTAKSRNPLFVAEYGATDAKAPGHRRRNWSIRRQLHTGLLLDVVSKLSCNRAPHGMAEGRYFCSHAVHGRFRRSAVGRLAVGSFAQANRQREPGTQTADRWRI